MDDRRSDRELLLRPATEADLEPLWHLIHDDLTWKLYDAPYYDQPTWTLEEFRNGYFQALTRGDRALVIDVKGKPVGTVSYHWVDKATRWMEVGIALCLPASWGRHFGRRALGLWVSHLFSRFEIEHIGLTTWSGNPRMIACAEAVGMVQVALIPKVRYFEGEYFDSVKLGVLREEWQADDSLSPLTSWAKVRAQIQSVG